MEETKDIKPIDITAIIKKLWVHRKKYYYVLPATLVITYLFMLSFPRYYKSTVSMAPETSGTSISGSLESLASSFGLGGALGKMNTTDAIYAEIYPEVVGSKNFITELMTVDVMTQDGSVKCNYYTYMRHHQAAPWWTHIVQSIKNIFKKPEPDTYNGKGHLSVFNHTREQGYIFDAIQNKITCNYDKRTDIFSIIVKDQDPLVSATMAEATSRKLQEFIIKYRTNKARHDLEYAETLQKQAKKDFERARRLYVEYMDANQDVQLLSAQQKQNDLENDMQLQYNNYTALCAQVIDAKAKVQEVTPAFTPLQSATVPLGPTSPKKEQILLICLFLAALGTTVYALQKENQLKPLLGLS